MRTADEIFSENVHLLMKSEIIKAINEARIEAIKECAKSARTRTNDESTSVIVDKQSILKLIDEVK